MGPLKWGDPEYCPGRRPMKLALGTGPIFLSEIKNKTKQQLKKKVRAVSCSAQNSSRTAFKRAEMFSICNCNRLLD